MGLRLKFSLVIVSIIFSMLLVVSVVLSYRSIVGLEADLQLRNSLLSEKLLPELLGNFGDYYTYQYDTYTTFVQYTLKNHPDLEDLRIVNADSELIFTTDELKEHRTTGKDPQKITDPIISEVIQTKKTYKGFITENGVQQIRIIAPYVDKFDTFRNVVEFHFSLREVQAAIQETVLFFVMFLVVFTVVGIVVAAFFVGIVIKPIELLKKASIEVSKGDLNQVVSVTTKDEVGALATSFNQMVKGLKEGKIALEEERLRLNSSINSFSLGFVMVDLSGNIILANPAAQTILGSDLHGKKIDAMQSMLGTNIALIDTIAKSHAEKKLLELKDAVFGLKFLHLFVTPILSEKKGEDIGTVILFEDITEAKIMERSKDEFFSIASHELRTPLTAIRGNTSMMKDMYAEQLKDPELITMIDDVHGSAVRLIDIVNDFLSVSSLEMGKIEFKKEAFDLVALVAETVKELTDQATQKKLKVVVGKTPKTLQVFADKGRTKEVLTNLVGNAIKYTEKGSIVVDVGVDDGVFAKISVVDTGNGISAENQKLLFHKFQQAGDSLLTRDTTRSTGLGLYICKLLVEGIGGKIWLDTSEVGKGSTFAFTVPMGDGKGKES